MNLRSVESAKLGGQQSRVVVACSTVHSLVFSTSSVGSSLSTPSSSENIIDQRVDHHLSCRSLHQSRRPPFVNHHPSVTSFQALSTPPSFVFRQPSPISHDWLDQIGSWCCGIFPKLRLNRIQPQLLLSIKSWVVTPIVFCVLLSNIRAQFNFATLILGRVREETNSLDSFKLSRMIILDGFKTVVESSVKK
uniref:Uncharacterized protein n=1 Tax=Cucumis melo TaxID=3656 RepID=A0A9I9EL24_CUCME